MTKGNPVANPVGYESLLRESLESTDRLLELAIEDVRESGPNWAVLQKLTAQLTWLRSQLHVYEILAAGVLDEVDALIGSPHADTADVTIEAE